MTTKEMWKSIQGAVGAGVDGVPGRETAKKLMAKLGLQAPARAALSLDSFVTGKGRGIKRIVVHCAATPEGKDFDVDDVRRWHTAPRPQGQGWSRIGYHFIIKLDGTIQRGLAEERTGIHVRGRNTGSIAVCYIGGVDARMKAKDTRTPDQKEAMERLVKQLVAAYPAAEVLGHRDHLGVRKACPSFDVRAWWEAVR